MLDADKALVERLKLHTSWRDSQGELNNAPNLAATRIEALPFWRKAMGEAECSCPIGVMAGSYENQSARISPNGKQVGIDNCLLNEIEDLWGMGVDTIESCCGHGRTTGYIAVTKPHVQTMLDLGYKRDPRTKAPGVFLWPMGENPVTVGKVYACELILRTSVSDDLRTITQAWKAMDRVFQSQGWQWADILREYQEQDNG